MRISDSLLPALLFAAAVSARANHGKMSGLRLRRRSTEHKALPGVRPESPATPRMFRRAVCPAYAPNPCDTFWCAQVCCGDGNGDYCLFGEYCIDGTEWCCIVGQPCAHTPTPTTKPTAPITTGTTRSSATLTSTNLLTSPSLTTRPTTTAPLTTRPLSSIPSLRPSTTSPRPSTTTSRRSSSTSPQSPDATTLPSATSTSTRSRDQLKALVLDALEEVPDIDLFAKAVKDQEGLFALLDPSSDYTILAPRDSAGAPDGNGAGSGGIKAQLALAFVQQGRSDSQLAVRPKTLKTALQDSDWVNLGEGEPARLVSTPTSPANVSIIAGMGRSVLFAGQGSEFSAGTIHVGSDYFTLPEGLDTTLRGTNGSAFATFLANNGHLDSLSAAEGVTIFALTDSAVASTGSRLTKATLDQGVIQNLKYTPDFVGGGTYTTAAGSKITLSFRSGTYYANGVKIVGPNIITSNGVVHYVADIIPANTSNSPGKSPISPFITLLAVVAALTPYYLMG